jgi:hypothetical protein
MPGQSDIPNPYRRKPALITLQKLAIDHGAANLEQRGAPRLLQHICWLFPSRLPINRLTIPSTALLEIRRPSLRNRL